tara:strand:- start:3221 stop:4240 length:1020 start_codon:yes stop_codon:yes gene_type:complete
MTKILVTGGSGFIGSNFIHYIMKKGNYSVINLDNLTYAGNEKNNEDYINNPNYSFIRGDITCYETVGRIFNQNKIHFLVNFAAESHVDRSINDPKVFLNTNIIGTYNLLRVSLENKSNDKNFKFLHVSTDEVYGSLGLSDKSFTEENRYQPNSPYSASKAASDHLVRAWFHTYKLNVITSNCSNNYGPFQFPEKLIPLTILNALNGKEITIYGDGSNIRDWLYVEDHCDAIYNLMTKGKVGEVYNIGGNSEKTNLEVVEIICESLDDLYPTSSNFNISKNINSYRDLITFVEDRPGHDFRYSIDASKISSDINWKPNENFKSGIKKTILWYLKNFLANE